MTARRLIQSVQRANSHLRYWAYRRRRGGDGPTLMLALLQWWRRFRFEMFSFGSGA